MGMLKLTRFPGELQGSGCLVKEMSGKYYVLMLKDGAPVCFETRSAPTQTAEGQVELAPDAKQVQVYDDGNYWVQHKEATRPQTDERVAPQQGFGLGQLVQDGGVQPLSMAPPPPPLVPFAGLDRKAMPPSPVLLHKQAKHIESAGKGASRKIAFTADKVQQGQKQISDYFVKPPHNASIDTNMEMEF